MGSTPLDVERLRAPRRSRGWPRAGRRSAPPPRARASSRASAAMRRTSSSESDTRASLPVTQEEIARSGSPDLRVLSRGTREGHPLPAAGRRAFGAAAAAARQMCFTACRSEPVSGRVCGLNQFRIPLITPFDSGFCDVRQLRLVEEDPAAGEAHVHGHAAVGDLVHLQAALRTAHPVELHQPPALGLLELPPHLGASFRIRSASSRTKYSFSYGDVIMTLSRCERLRPLRGRPPVAP